MGTTYLTDGDDLTSVANAIRAKSGGSSQLAFPAGFVSGIQAIPSGGGVELLATATATEPVTAFKIDYDQSMDGYELFLIEVEGTASGTNMFICPQVNSTDQKTYYGNASSFHRFYWVVPTYSRAYPPLIEGWGVCVGKVSSTQMMNNYSAGALSYFYVRSFYDYVTFSAGTTVKIWGLKK